MTAILTAVMGPQLSGPELKKVPWQMGGRDQGQSVGSGLGPCFAGECHFLVTGKVDSCSPMSCTSGAYQAVHQLSLSTLCPNNSLLENTTS